MKRRNFFRAVGGAAAVAPVAEALATEPAPLGCPVCGEAHLDCLVCSDNLTYKGFDISWTGWKENTQNLWIAGQWIAISEDGSAIRADGSPAKFFDGIYSSFPGSCGFFRKGDTFDLTMTLEQEAAIIWYVDASPISHRDRPICKQHALDRLKRFIDDSK